MEKHKKCDLSIRFSTERQTVEEKSLDKQEERLREFYRVRN